MILRVKKVHPEAKIPQFAHHNDAALDLYTVEDVAVPVGEVARIRSGIALEIPEGYAGLCWDRSGLSMNHSIKVLAGVIDEGFRGEVVMAVINLGKENYYFKKGERVMQMLVQKVEHPEIQEVTELSESVRGEKGFGSTGK